jgi:hypothetical protein
MDSPRQHVAIVAPWAASALLDGRKRVETRFSRSRRAPFGRVRRGDTVYFKLSGGPMLGGAQVFAVKEFAEMNAAKLAALRRQHAADAHAPAAYWALRRRCRYAVIITLGPLRPAPRDLAIPRQYGGGWVVLGG